MAAPSDGMKTCSRSSHWTDPRRTNDTRKITCQLLRRSLLVHADEGSTIVFALVFVLVVLSTSLLISNRGLSGLLGSVFNQESKLARDAAEIGVLRAVMLLNEPRNRQLLVNANLIDGLTAGEASGNSQYLNRCPLSPPPNLTASGSSMGIKASAGSSYPTIDIDDGSSSNGIQRKFRIQSIQQNGLPNLSSGTAGGIIISVQGQALKDAKVIATSTVTRELEVIEKCCGLSLGGPSGAFGADARDCDRGNPGLGLIAGSYFKNNGLFNTTGGSGITFRDENGNAIPAVYCLDDSPSNDCSNGGLRSGTGTQLVEVAPSLNDVPSIPSFPSGSTSCDGVTNSSCEIQISGDLTLSTADFANWGTTYTATICTLSSCGTSVVTSPITATNTITSSTVVSNILQCRGNKDPVESCRRNRTYIGTPSSITIPATSTSIVTVGTSTSIVTIGLSTSIVSGNPELAELKSHCFQQNESGTTVTYCSLNRLEIANTRELRVDTTSGPLRLFFPNPSTSSNPTVELKNGQSAIIQTNSAKSPLSYTDLTFYGISRADQASKCSSSVYTSACQQIELGGGSAGSSSFFAYFPTGETSLQGNATINGVVWSNIINATGSTNFVTSSSGVGEVLNLIGMIGQTPGGGGNISLLSEYVTRLTRQFRFF